MPWLQMEYMAEQTGRPAGHTVFIINVYHFFEILDRYHITPDQITKLKINGKKEEPELLISQCRKFAQAAKEMREFESRRAANGH